jgi:uncharacterized RDD family membrane protein YckC
MTARAHRTHTVGLSRRTPHQANVGSVIARAVALLAACALLAIGLPREAKASPPGTMQSVAAGDGHLWWVVRRQTPAVPGAARAGETPEYILMHHASEEPAPTERFVMRLGGLPEAMAADGASLVIVMPAAGERGRMVLTLGTRRNPAVGHWYSEPRGGPRVLEPLDSDGIILSSEMVGETAYLLRRTAPEEGVAALELLALETESAGAEWRTIPLPDVVERVADGAHARLFRSDGALALALADGEGTRIARPRNAGWDERSLRFGGAQEPDGVDLVGSLEFGGATVLVWRDQRVAGAPADAERPTIRLSILRDTIQSDWASFPEPLRPFALAAFGAGVAVLELDEAGRGTVRSISPTSNAPGTPVGLNPPGFASARWIHLPILSAVAVAFLLSAMLFGAGGLFVAARPDAARPDAARPDAARPDAAPPSRARGASLGRRLAAFLIDASPGFVLTWIVVGGAPFALLEHPMFSPDIVAALPAVVALGVGWAVGLLGDAILGRSPGKRAMGLAVVGPDGLPAPLGRRILRSALALVPVCAPPVMLFVLVHPLADGPAEVLSGTAVVVSGTAVADDRDPAG